MSPALEHPRFSPSTPSQACDRCRVQKLRCEIDPQAQHCIECIATDELCSWDLPPLDGLLKPPRRPAFTVSDSDDSRGSLLSMTRQSSITSVESSGQMRDRTYTAHRSGPSSIPYILHSMPTLPMSRILSDYCVDKGFRMVRTEGLDGYISVTSEVDAHWHPPPSGPSSWIKAIDGLVADYIDSIGELLPIVTASEAEQAGPVLRHAMAAVAATRNCVSPSLFQAIRQALPYELDQSDVHFIPKLENVQTLLVLCLVDELGDRPRVSPVSVQRDRLSAAYRLALDLGLARSRLERETRVWRCLQVMDAWRAAKDGLSMLHPFPAGSEPSSASSSTMSSSVNSPSISPALSQLPSVAPLSMSLLNKSSPGHIYGNTFFERLYSLSKLLSRVLALMYGPDGITDTDTSALRKLQHDLTSWRDSLPLTLKFDYNSAKFQTVRTQRRVQESGLLLVFYTGVRFLFFRPLMPWSFLLPKKFRQSIYVSTDEWVDLMKLSRYSIDFAINLEEASELLFFFGVYTLNLASLVLYHTWARRGEWDGSIYLDKARRCYDRLVRGPGTHLPFLKRDMSMIEMLLRITELTLDRVGAQGARGLNPIPGVLNSLAESTVSGVMMLRQGEGEGFVMVATPEAARELQDIPPGTIVLGSLPEAEASEI